MKSKCFVGCGATLGFAELTLAGFEVMDGHRRKYRLVLHMLVMLVYVC